jgi:GTP-binding protein
MPSNRERVETNQTPEVTAPGERVLADGAAPQAAPSPQFIVAIVGRPNVGKSTLFNRIIGEQRAITAEWPGTTRDRIYAEAEWAGRLFTVVDTGGIDLTAETGFAAQVTAQARLAMQEADVIIFVVDGREGITPADSEIAELLRHSKVPVVVAVNKVDNPARADQMRSEFYALGLGEPLAISALQGIGIGDLLDEVVASIPRAPQLPEESEVEEPKIAIVGRPNVGKSQLLNTLLGYERSIVSEIPGTTRDVIDTRFQVDSRPVVLLDTAGIRRRGRIEPGVEKYSVLRALRAINRADVVLWIIDATEGITAQDLHVLGYVVDAARGVVMLINKWDLIEDKARAREELEAQIKTELNWAPWIPYLFISALTGRNVNRVLPQALEVYEERKKRVPTAALNDVILRAVAAHPPPFVGRKRLKIYYVTQPQVAPPTFVFFVNDPTLVHFSYERFLENRIREAFGFTGVPIRLVFRGHHPAGERDRRGRG